MKIKEIMNKVFTVDSDISIKKAAEILSKNNIGSLVFYKKNKLKGIITERDILKSISNQKKRISFIMSKKIIIAEIDKDFEEVIGLMAKHKVKRIIILDKGKLAGIVTATDIIAYSDLLHEDLFF